jgi:hypothetical protein
LGLLAVLPNSNIIYSLQTAAYARKFMTTRITAALEKSEKLKQLLDKNVDSADLKKIGSSYLHVVGAHSDSQAISVPCAAVVYDEVSFCNPSVIGTFMSRLEHLPEEKKTLAQFSTPLYSGMGVTLAYEHGTQHRYMCYHERCAQWVVVDPVTDIVIPGFDKPLTDLLPADLIDPNVAVDKAWIKCRCCGNEITRANLADASRRAWVPTFKDRLNQLGVAHSYQVMPTDVAGIKSIPQIVRSLSLYKKTDKFFQYSLGVPFDSAEAMILPGVLDNAFSAAAVASSQKVYGSVIGVDVGKTSHLVHAWKQGDAVTFFGAEKIVQTGEGALQQTVYDRYMERGCTGCVIDQAPDFSSVKALQGILPYNRVWGAYFTRGGKNKLEAFELKEGEGLVAISRTRMLDHFVKQVNSGKVKFAVNTAHQDEIKLHLLNMKRIEDYSATGEDVSRWISTSPETHFFMACVYAFTALEMQDAAVAPIILSSAGTIVSRIRLKTAA